MPEMTAFEPGTPSWTGLATTDTAAAEAFYTALFDWTAGDQPIGDGAYYTMLRLNGRDAAALYDQPEEQRRHKAPPNWTAYITVESADDSARDAESASSKVRAPSFDVMEAGRMSVVQDPGGAVFPIWQLRRRIKRRRSSPSARPDQRAPSLPRPPPPG